MGLWDKIKSGASAVGNFLTGGGQERRRSERIEKNAKEDRDHSMRRLEEKIESTNSVLETLGELRKSVREGEVVTDFVNLYSTVAAINKNKLSMPEDSVDQHINSDTVKMLPSPEHMKEMMLGSSMGALGGAAAAYGAYGLAGIVGTASTGTAISSLGGVAATNATLAWLGGGAASAGGLGTVGGAAVLGGIALIPAAALAMYFGRNAAKKRLNEALNFSDEIEVYVAQCNTKILQLDQVEQAAKLLHRTVISMEAVVKAQNSKMRHAIKETVDRARELQDCIYLELIDERGQYKSEARSAYQALLNGQPETSALPSQHASAESSKQFRVEEKNSKTPESVEA